MMGNDTRDPGLEQWLLARISHDMRSPFSSMIGVLQLLLDEWETMPHEIRKDFIQDLLGSSRIQLLQLDNLAFLSRRTRGINTFIASKIQLSSCIDLARRRLLTLDPSSGTAITFETPGNPVIMADPQHLELLIMNAVLWVWHVSKDAGARAIMKCTSNVGENTGAVMSFFLEPSGDKTQTPPVLQVPGPFDSPPGIENPDFNYYMVCLISADLPATLKTSPDSPMLLSLGFQ